MCLIRTGGVIRDWMTAGTIFARCVCSLSMKNWNAISISAFTGFDARALAEISATNASHLLIQAAICGHPGAPTVSDSPNWNASAPALRRSLYSEAAVVRSCVEKLMNTFIADRPQPTTSSLQAVSPHGPSALTR
jgi:hypothetical protein